MRASLLLCLLTVVTVTLSAQQWDASKIENAHQWLFKMSQNGDSIGHSSWMIQRLGSQLLLSEESNVPRFKEDMFLYVDANTLQPDSMLVSGRMSGFPIECKARWQGNRVEGFAQFPRHPSRPVVSLTQDLPAGTKIRFMSFLLSPFYRDLEVGSTFSYPQFSTQDGQVRTITAKVTARELVEVMGESVEALKLELSGGVAEQNIYIDPIGKRIVRISFRDLPIVYELIAD